MSNADRPNPPRYLSWLAWLPLIIILAYTLVTVILQTTVCAPVLLGWDKWGWLPTAVSGVGFGVIGALIMTHQPRNRIGWLCGVIALLPILFSAPSTFLACAEQGLITLPGLSYLAWLSSLGLLALTLQFLLLPLLFPDGHFLSPGWRRFALVIYSLLFLGFFVSMIWPGELLFYEAGKPRENPIGLPFQPSPSLTGLVRTFTFVTVLVGILIANFSLAARWRRSEGVARQQLKVLAYYLVTIGTVFMLFQLIGLLLEEYQGVDIFNMWGTWVYSILLILLWAGYPVAVGVSVLKYRMYDIDIVIRRTLIYGLLSLSLGFIFFAGVILLQRIFALLTGTGSSPAAIVLSTLAIAALFGSLRKRLQDIIDRRFYRRKYDAQKTLEAFARFARDETDMDDLTAEILRVVQETMQPEKVELWLNVPREERQPKV